MRIYIYLNIISLNCARQLHLRYIEMTDRSMYYFFIVVLYTQFKSASRITNPRSIYIAELGSSNTIEIEYICLYASPLMTKYVIWMLFIIEIKQISN